jgi:hypothetical protein
MNLRFWACSASKNGTPPVSNYSTPNCSTPSCTVKFEIGFTPEHSIILCWPTFPRYTSTIMASRILDSALANFPSGLLPEDLLTSAVDIGGHWRQDFTLQVIDLMMTQYWTANLSLRIDNGAHLPPSCFRARLHSQIQLPLIDVRNRLQLTDHLGHSNGPSLPPTLSRLNNCDSHLERLCRELVQ